MLSESLSMTTLHFFDGNKWSLLPEWGSFFITIGKSIAKQADNKIRLVTGVTVPTRAYAASLAGVGIVITRAVNPFNDADGHYRMICSLSYGTPLLYPRDGRKLKGIFVGCEEIEGKKWIKIQLERKTSLGGGLTQFVSPQDVSTVHMLGAKSVKLPKRQKGRRIIPHEIFLKSLLDSIDTYNFSMSTSLDCVIVGRKALLQPEIKDTVFAVKPSDSESIGTLQDILRIKQYLGKDDSYHSEILKVFGRKTPETTGGLVPFITIFDGAYGFVKWRDRFRQSHWIVILDRTETYFKEAIAEFNREYLRNHGKEGNLHFQAVPPGIELVNYVESR